MRLKDVGQSRRSRGMMMDEAIEGRGHSMGGIELRVGE
jgi:hypothetical protein